MNTDDLKKAAVVGVVAGATVSAIGLTAWLVWGAISIAALAFAFMLYGTMELKNVLSPMWPVVVGAVFLIVGLIMTVVSGKREEIYQQISLIVVVASLFAGCGIALSGYDPSIVHEQAAAADDYRNQLLNIREDAINGLPWFFLVIGFLGTALGGLTYLTSEKRPAL